MQEQHEQNLEEELQWLKERLGDVEEERDVALDELREAKKEAEEANSRLNEAFATQKIYTELNTVKKLVASTTQELKIKQKEIELLKSDVESAKKLEVKLSEKEAQLKKLNEDLVMARNVRPQDWRKKIQQLEHQLARHKDSEAKVFESLVIVTKQLEQTKISLEESRHEVCCLRDKHDDLSRKNRDCTPRNCFKDSNPMRETLENLSIELYAAKESLARAQEGEKAAMSKAQGLLVEIGKLRNELKLVHNAEVNNKKAMDDLAIALSEVATESNHMKVKLDLVEVELGQSKLEAEELKAKGRGIEEKFKTLIEESRKEAEKNKNAAERLRLEAEETLQTWNEKESGLVGCIRIFEEEKTVAQQENIRLLDSLRAADNMVRAAKDEKNKLRDILKQALNEANAAKEAANIAKVENSQLKNCLAEKDDALDFLTQEIDNLRANEAAAMENIKELKRMISELYSSERDPVEPCDNNNKERNLKKQHTMEKKENPNSKSLRKSFSFNIMRINSNKHKDISDSVDNKEKCEGEGEGEGEGESEGGDSAGDGDLLKGSIFDEMESPESEIQRRKNSSSFMGDGEILTPEDLDQLEASHLNDFENGRFSSRRRRLLRRFGDLLIRRRSYADASRS